MGLCGGEQMAAGRCCVRSRAEEPWLLLECPQQPNTKPAGVKLALFVIIMWSLQLLWQFVASWINLLTPVLASLACGVSC